MENLRTESENATEQIQIIRKGDLVNYQGELWIIKELGEDTADLIDPNNRSNIAPGVKRLDITKEATVKTAPDEEYTPGRLLEQYCVSVGEILEPEYTFSKQGQTFAEARGDLEGILPERQKIIVETGCNNGYEYINFSDPENQN